jgi:hypothetical protein
VINRSKLKEVLVNGKLQVARSLAKDMLHKFSYLLYNLLQEYESALQEVFLSTLSLYRVDSQFASF